LIYNCQLVRGKVILKFYIMPIFFQKDIDFNTRLAIWKIEESEDFFLEKAVPQRMVSHPHKRLQHLAGRYLLRFLFPEFPLELIKIADTRKPFLEDEAYHFSISHCGDFAAAIVSRTHRVGVDIEEIRQTVAKVHHKFVSPGELAVMNACFQPPVPSLRHLTLLWSCKEAVYKWFGWGEVDFKDHIVLNSMKQITGTVIESAFSFRKTLPVSLHLHSQSFEGLVLSYVAT
jgi:phosphopantetheinyl transferase